MKILYFTFIENPFAPETSGVMRGQVINLLEKLGSCKTDCCIEWLAIINTSVYTPEETEIRNLKKELEENNIKLALVFFPDKMIFSRWNLAYKKLKQKVQDFKPDLVHCRAYPATHTALKLKYKYDFKLIFDARGLYPEQIKERSPNIIGKIRYCLWKYHEKNMLKSADLIIGVSEPFIEHYKKIYKNGNYKFIPCCFKKKIPLTTSQIIDLKKELGYTLNDVIITYSGNISAKYSSLNLIIKLMSEIHKLNKDTKFLFLTRSNTSKLTKLLKNEKLYTSSKIFNLKPDKVHQYISISDIGILYREESKINEVAIPTKFAEYLSAGVPIITSKSLKGLSKIISTSNIGLTLETPNISNTQLNNLLQIDKNHCLNISESFELGIIADDYYNEYLKLL